MLRIEGLCKSYDGGDAGPLQVLRGIDLEIDAGESVAVVGPSGCGKSTLLNIMGALEPPTSGHVMLDGAALEEMTADELARVRNLDIGYVFQAHHLLPQCTALENVLLPTLAGNLDAAARADSMRRADELLELVGLKDRRTHRPARLSGGECQRVAVVRALVNRPRLLLADEPTGALDEATAEDLAAVINDLHERESLALVTVTHSPRLAAMMGRTLRLEGGRLVSS